MVSLVSSAGGSAALEREVDWTSRLADVELGGISSYLTLRENLEWRGVCYRFHKLTASNTCAKIHGRVSSGDFVSPRHFLRILRVVRDAGLLINNVTLSYADVRSPEKFLDILREDKTAGLQISDINLEEFPCMTHTEVLTTILQLHPELRTSRGLTCYKHYYYTAEGYWLLGEGIKEVSARIAAGIQMTGLSFGQDPLGSSTVGVLSVRTIISFGLNSKLTYLNLEGCCCDDTCLVMIGQRGSNLEELDLGTCRGNISTVTEEGLVNLFPHLPNLKKLWFGPDIPVTRNIFHSIVESCPKFERLELAGKIFHRTTMDSDELQFFMVSCFSLTLVLLQGCKNISKDTIEAWNHIRPTLKVVRA